MSSIDERVVAMKFQDGQFQTGISRTMSALDKLKAGLNLSGATKGINELDEAGKRFSLAGMANAAGDVSAKFVAMATVAITALTNITNRAIDAGVQIAKSLTIDPIKLGLEEYETGLNSVQTILSNTKSKGGTIETVNAALQELNKYSDQTIYNFAEMARNIGTFTAAGVDLNVSTQAIKGIANLAAVSGSNSQQASTAMYQLSQALASGKVSLMDWNSVVNAGMGGEVFQKSLIETAKVHGVNVEKMIKKEGSFRETLQHGWLSSQILTETLSKFTGDMTAEQLKQIGYTDKQIEGILDMGKTAQDAATKVKTMSQLIGTLQESSQSGWAQTWQIIFGDFEEAKELFTGVNNVLGAMIGASSDARNKMLQDWKDLGGRTVLIEGIKNAFDALMAVIKPFQDAFREIFPPATGQQLYNITAAFRDFTARLKPSEQLLSQLGRIAKGVFSALDIGVMIVKGLWGVFKDLFGEVGKGSGGLIEMGANIGDWIVKVRDALKNGEQLNKFFSKMSEVLRAPVAAIREFAGWLKDSLSEGISLDAFSGGFERLKDRMEPLGGIGEKLARTWEKVVDGFNALMEKLAPVREAVSNFFRELGSKISEWFGEADFDSILDLVNTGLIAGIALLIKKFISNFSLFGDAGDVGGGLFDTIKSAFGGLTDTLDQMQNTLKSGTLVAIAAAVLLLTGSVIALSMIDSDKLTKALAALTAMFTQLFTSMLVFEKISGMKGLAQMPFVAAAMILLAGALLILSVAVKNLAELEWEGIAKGLTAVTGLLVGLVVAVRLMSSVSGNMVSMGAGLILVAAAIKILESAVKGFAEMNWDEMLQGLAGVGMALAALGIFTQIAKTSKGAVANAVGLVILGAALKVIASALKDYAGMPWDEMGKGFAVMAAALVIMSGALRLIPATAIVGAASLIVVAQALKMVADVVTVFGGMSLEQMAIGLAALAGSLIIIAGGVALMTSAIAGAAALLLISAALTIFVPVLQALGAMDWGSVGKGLAILAVSLLALAALGVLITPLAPALLLLGAAILLIGAGVAAAGLGVAAFALGLTALAAAGTGAAAVIELMIRTIIGQIPAAMQALGEGIAAFATVISQSGPQFVAAMTTLIMSLLTAINTVAPEIIATLFNLIMTLLNQLAVNVPKFVDAGLRMITGILNGIASNIGGIVTAATNIIVNFLNAISANLPRIIQAGINLIITFVESLADGIRRNTARMNAAAKDLAMAIIDGMTGGLGSGISKVINKAKEVAQSALNAAKNLLGIKSPSREFFKVGAWSTEGMANGISKTGLVVKRATESVASAALNTMRNTMSNVGNFLTPDMDISPTIKPVLDLSNIRKDSGQINDMLRSATISPDTSYAAAVNISKEKKADDEAYSGSDDNPGTTEITFVQNNNSPRALSQGEIYRQTKNQLSKVREGLPV